MVAPLLASLASAAPIAFRLESISVDYSSSWRSGLAIRVGSLSVDSYFTLDEGESASMSPFEIGTPESLSNGRDSNPRAISAAFAVTVLDSGDLLTGSVTGTTVGNDANDIGVVTWDGPATLGGGGVELQVALADATFPTPGDVEILTTFSRPGTGASSGGSGGSGGSNMPEPTSAVLFLVGGFVVRRAVSRHRH